MFFIIQEEKDNLNSDLEFIIIKDLLNRTKHTNEYVTMKLNDFYNIFNDEDSLEIKKEIKTIKDFDEKYQNAIPIGTIQFVTTWLNIFKGIEMENAIEIPPILRTDEFLKRKYSIRKSVDIPKSGRYFIKDATQLKVFSYCGELEYFLYDDMFKPPKSEMDFSLKLNPDHLYQVSEIVDVLSEYRVYIIDGKIVSIENYDGNPMLFPDVTLINKANLLYSTQPDYPKSYSMDIMITNRGSAITEIHNFTSLGLYSTLWGTDLLYAYRDGINYLTNYNTLQTEFSNF